MTLIDTSAWIHSLRRDGDPQIRERVASLLVAGTAAWCPIVRTELWNGARGGREQRMLREMERDLIELPLTPAVWNTADEFARSARAQGVTVPTVDLVVQACANHHGTVLLHADQHLRMLEEL